MKSFENPTIEVRDVIVEDVITASWDTERDE